MPLYAVVRHAQLLLLLGVFQEGMYLKILFFGTIMLGVVLIDADPEPVYTHLIKSVVAGTVGVLTVALTLSST
jgi:hypothetical protein